MMNNDDIMETGIIMDVQDVIAELLHELKNPLACVKMNVDLLKDYDLDAETRNRCLEIIDRQITSTLHIIDNLNGMMLNDNNNELIE